MLENLKKYWFLYGFLAGSVVWIATIDSKTFDNPEQKVKVINFVKDSPSPAQQMKVYILDSIDKNSAINKRIETLKQQVKSDSIRAINDSLFLDMVKRQTVQIEQIKERLNNE